MLLRLSSRTKIFTVILVALVALTLLVNFYRLQQYFSRVKGVIKRDYLWETFETENSIQISQRKLVLFIGIYSAPLRRDRRAALRETWLPKCHSSQKAVCRFVTDGQDAKGNNLKGEIRTKLENEVLLHGDLLLAESPGGTNFPRRYLWMAQWASERYNFEYFLRLDDDYFICFDKMLLELEFHRPKERFQWGWLHCEVPGYVALDEGFSMVSKDLIESFLRRKNTTLLCHIWDGQAIALWLQNIPNITTFGDNARIFHHAFDSREMAAKRQEICQTAIAIHKSYPKEMRLYWSIYQKEKKINVTVPPLAFPCHWKRNFDYRIFRGGRWFAEPKLCKDNPIWDKGEYFKGRQEESQ